MIEMLAIAQWRCGLKIDNAIVLGKVLHYYGKLLYYGQILVCRENRSPRENFDTRYDNTSKSFPGFWERGWDTLIEVMPPFHQRLTEPFNTLLLEKKWKKNNNSTIMESTEFTNAFFICHASSRVSFGLPCQSIAWQTCWTTYTSLTLTCSLALMFNHGCWLFFLSQLK